MKNIIRINLDVNERNESNIGIPLPQKVIRSKDTAVIIEMRIIGYDVNDGYTFTLLSEYTKSKRHTLYTIGDKLKIEGNVVTFVPPAELISTLEIVTNTLYIEKSGMSLDFSKFHYLAQLSEVDNTVGPVKEVYDDNYQALIDELEFKYMLIEDLTAEYVAAQVAEARVGVDGTIYRFLKERLDVEHQKVTAQVGEVSNQLELTNNEIIDARGGKPTLRVRLNEIDRVDEYGKHWTLIDGEWEERVGQSQLINVRGEVAWAMAEAEQAKEDAVKAYEDAVAEAKRSADIEDALIRTKIKQEISAVETEMTTAKQEAKDAANQALSDAKAHADAEVQASKEHFDGLIAEVESEVADAQATADSAVEQIDTAVENAGFTSLDETISSVQSISNQAQINASTAIDDAQDAMSNASTAITTANQAKEDAQTALTEAGEAVDSANTAKTNAQTALEDAQTALSTAENADTKSGLAETAANTAKTNAQTAIDDAQSALTEAGNAKTTADTLSIKVDDLEGEVELKASQTEVDGISGTVSTHTTTLSQHATAISSKAESELVDTIKGTVDTHTTEISQNATDIASKANATTVNTLTGRVDTAESNISQNATAITQRVTTTTYNTGIANKENTVLKQTTAPTHVNGRLWLDTSVTPNILKRSNGTTWIKATPTTPGEVGAYSQSDGAGLAGRLTTAETNITQTATAITSKADKSTVDTLEGIISTQGTTLTQQADLIASKASQTEVDTVKGTVAGHTTTISQHANQIASKAESSLVNAIKGTVDNHTTEISQNATDIASKASSTSVNSLTGRVSTAETTISQHATAITSKASQTEVDTVKGTVAGHTSTLSQHATEIGARLTSSQVNSLVDGKGFSTVNYVDNQITASASGIRVDITRVEGKIDGLEIGGRNLLRNSKERVLPPKNTGNAADNFSYATLEYPTVDGQTYTLSADVEITHGTFSTITSIVNYLNTGQITHHLPIENGRITITYVARVTTNSNLILLYAGYASETRGNGVIFRNIKIEKGNIATDWTPAPEDTVMEDDFTAFKGEYEATAENLSSRLTAVDKAGGRLATAETNISQNATAIGLKASQSSVSTLTGTVNTLSGRVDVTAGQISSKVWSTDIQTAVDGIEVGGRNLFVTTNTVSGYESQGNITPSTENHRTMSNLVDISDTKSLIYQVWNPNKITIASNINRVAFFTEANVHISSFVLPNLNGSTYQMVKINVPTNARKARLGAIMGASTIDPLIRVKFEKGNKTTDWTPAPEDTTAIIDHVESELTQKHDSITATVSSIDGRVTTNKLSLDGTVTRVGTAEGKITQIETSVSGLQTTVASKASQTQVTQLATGMSTVVSKTDQISEWTRLYSVNTANPSELVDIDGSRLSRWFSYEIILGVVSTGTVTSFMASLTSNSTASGWTLTVHQSNSGGSNNPYIYLNSSGNPMVGLYNHTTKYSVYATVKKLASRNRTSLTMLSDNINLRVSKGDVLSQINIEANRTLIQSNKLVLDANSVVFTGSAFIPSAQIESVHADKINAGTISSARIDAKTIVTNGLAANVVSSNHIIANEALVDKVFSNQASVDRLWAKNIWANKITAMEIDAGKITSGTINAARLNVTDLRSKILTANVIDATQINGSAAVFNKLFSTSSATSRLVAQGAWIENANIKSIDASKINAGTISANRISTTSLDNVIIGGRNYFVIKDLTPKPYPLVGNDHEYRYNLKPNTTYTISTWNTIGSSFRVNGLGVQFSITGDKGYKVTTDSSGVLRLGLYGSSGETDQFINGSAKLKLEEGNKATDWTPAPEDGLNDLSINGKVEIHGGNIRAKTLDVGAITGNLGEFINLSLKAQNSQASLSGSAFKIESIANSQSYIEMSNVPEIRARSANSAMVVMGQGLTNYSVDNIERFYMGTKIDGTQHGIMIRKNHGWAIMRESDSFGGTPAKYYTVKSGQQRVAVVEALMRDSTVTEVPTGNETQFIINNNYLARLNGFSTSTSSTIAAPWPTLTTGQLIKYAEGTPGNQSGKQSIFKVWTANNTSVSAFDAHVTFNTGYSGASDRRIKHNIQDTSVEALSHINSLKFKEFKYNSDNRYEPLGIIAQDSGILRVKWEEMESIDIQRSIMLGLKGVQELHAKVNEQAEEIKQLKEIINQ